MRRERDDWVKWVLRLVSLVLIMLGTIAPLPALAMYSQVEEPPKGILFRSRESLRDRSGQSWQVVVFRYAKPEGMTSVTLRLVGFPGAAEFLHQEPLQIDSDRDEWQVFESPVAPQLSPNVGEYDVTAIVPQFPTTSSLKLRLPLKEAQVLRIPPFVVEEWQRVSKADA